MFIKFIKCADLKHNHCCMYMVDNFMNFTNFITL